MAVDRGDEFVADDVVVDEPEVKVDENVVEEPEVKVEEPEVKVEEPARDEKGKFIPKGRFDEAVGKERAARETAERKLAELQASLKQVDRNADTEKLEAEIVGLEKQHSKLILDGDHEKAAELMTQIRLKERTISIQEATHLSAQAKNEAREEIRMDAAIDSLEATYDVLNPDSDNFDEDLVEMVLSTKAWLITTERLTPSAALVKAAQKVMGKFSPKPVEADTAAKGKGLGAGRVAQDRKEAQVAKNIDTAKRQPASMKNSGLDSDKAGQMGEVDYTKLTSEERAALPEATRARLRGDNFE